MVAYLKRLHHGFGGNLERLYDKSNDEQAGDENRRDRGDKLQRALFPLGFGFLSRRRFCGSDRGGAIVLFQVFFL